MKYSVYRFTLDIHVTRSQVSIPVLYRDTGIRFLISLSDGGKPYVIQDGNEAVLYGKKADGNYLTHPCTINNNTEIIFKHIGLYRMAVTRRFIQRGHITKS